MAYANFEDLDRDGFGHYLAGFIDGEGCFIIFRNNLRSGTYACKFAVAIRMDDSAVLDEARERVGAGTRQTRRSTDPNVHPQAVWAVQSLGDCLRIVELLDRFPLRAKKRRDYAIWKRAVLLWAAMPPGNPRRPRDWSAMGALRDELRAVRRFPEVGADLSPEMAA